VADAGRLLGRETAGAGEMISQLWPRICFVEDPWMTSERPFASVFEGEWLMVYVARCYFGLAEMGQLVDWLRRLGIEVKCAVPLRVVG
jgi:hypothetical protein